MERAAVLDRYFEWLYGLVADNYETSYEKLFQHLFHREFLWLMEMDKNRAEDGLELRNRFADECHIEDAHLYLDQPCSVLEMMVALASRCEDQIMCDYTYGDRTSVWFWTMLVSLGLGGMSDDRYDFDYVARVLDIFLSRTYDYDGKGGLFYVENPPKDLRTMEIWYQMHLYLDRCTE